MKSIAEILVRKAHPEFEEEEIHRFIIDYYYENEKKIKLFLKHNQYGFQDVQKDMERKWLEEKLMKLEDREIQELIRRFDMFHTGVLVFVLSGQGRELIEKNVSKRMWSAIEAEAYLIAHKIPLTDNLASGLIQEVSQEIEKGFHFSKKTENETIGQIHWSVPLHHIVRWNPKGERFGIYHEEVQNPFDYEYLDVIITELEKLQYKEAMKMAFEYSRKTKGTSSFMLSGLETNELGKSLYVSYVLRWEKGKNIVYKRRNRDDSYPNCDFEFDNGPLIQVKEEMYLEFCKLHYREGVKYYHHIDRWWNA